jgi:hypothetical protein
VSKASQSSQSSGGNGSSPTGEKSSGAPAGEGLGQPSNAGEKAAAANTSVAASEGAALQRIQESGSEGKSRDADEPGTNGEGPAPVSEGANGSSSSGSPARGSGNQASSNKKETAPSASKSSGVGGQPPRIPAAPQARHGLATWGAYHAARIAAHGAVSAGSAVSRGMGGVGNALENPDQTGQSLGSRVGRIAGTIAKGAADGKDAVNTAAHAISHPSETASIAVDAISSSVKGKASEAKAAAAQVSRGFNEGYRSARNPEKSEEEK